MERSLVKTKPSAFPPPHLFLALALALFFWFASWTRLGVLGEYAFFPQWLGYILAVDGLVAWRKGASLLTRAPAEFAALFVLSAPVWWLFEGLNSFVLNWHYIGAETYPVWQIILIASIDFSTVVPAVFETTELIATFKFVERLRSRPRLPVSPRLPWTLMYVGAFAFGAVVLFPSIAFPLTWVWLVLLVDPLNYLRGRPSLLRRIENGDWSVAVLLGLAALVCGFFWEMWNYNAMPKWFYTVPHVGFLKLFEMPILGYGGYVPFAWELYALYHFVWGMLHRRANALTDM